MQILHFVKKERYNLLLYTSLALEADYITKKTTKKNRKRLWQDTGGIKRQFQHHIDFPVLVQFFFSKVYHREAVCYYIYLFLHRERKYYFRASKSVIHYSSHYHGSWQTVVMIHDKVLDGGGSKGKLESQIETTKHTGLRLAQYCYAHKSTHPTT